MPQRKVSARTFLTSCHGPNVGIDPVRLRVLQESSICLCLSLSLVDPGVGIAYTTLIFTFRIGLRWTSKAFTLFLCDFRVHDGRLSGGHKVRVREVM